MLNIPRHPEQIALFVKPINLLLEGKLARAAEVLEREVGLGHARVKGCLLCSHLFVVVIIVIVIISIIIVLMIMIIIIITSSS